MAKIKNIVIYDELAGLLLEHFREKAKMTVADAAGVLGVSVVTYEGVEDGVLPLQVAQLHTLTTALGMNDRTFMESMEKVSAGLEKRGLQVITLDPAQFPGEILTEDELWEEIRKCGKHD